MNNLSIVVPVLNEAENLEELFKRIESALRPREILYEIIVVDDNSTDETERIVQVFSEYFPIKLYKKVGKPGKAQSLIEGFSYANYELLGMIDGDLQYPPEAFPKMVKLINEGKDVVVANRTSKETSPIRKFTSGSFNYVFVKWLHKIDCDSQSGLKVLKKEIFERISLNPSPWTFDLEFLLKAINAGYKIGKVDIVFGERRFGNSKINLLKASTQIGLDAIKLKFADIAPVALHPDDIQKEGYGFHYKGKKFIFHSPLPINQSAFFRLSRGQVSVITLFIVVLILCALLNWFITLILFLSFLSVLYLADLFFNFFLIVRSFSKSPEILFDKGELAMLDEELPIYTIFCPLYKEWKVLPQFVKAIADLDYPKEKLEVLLLFEENDRETIEKARSFSLPEYFKIIEVPESNPKTKPKACNYGLQYTNGKYCVIYDAEDIPEKNQLKKAIAAFNKLPSNIACVQAKLNFYNPHQNLLTKVFTAEYSLWFDLVLTGLQSINAPIPLGGTSNHFKTEVLKKLKGWDAFNVTEDCDLGIRLFKKGFKTAIIDSTTYEEANSSLGNWFGQRSRWIKGYIQSYLVHMRKPSELKKDWKDPHIVSFQLIVGGKILSMLVNPFLWITTILYFTFRSTIGQAIESAFPAVIFYPAVFAAVVGNFLYFYYYMIGSARREYFSIIKYAYLVPVYWLFMSAAAWFAVFKIITQPHYWYKTKHGLHLEEKKSLQVEPELKNLAPINSQQVLSYDFT